MAPSEKAQESSPPVGRLLLVQGKRAEEIEGAEVPPFVKPPGQNADDFVRLSVNPNRAADDIATRAETLLPAALTQNNHVIATSDVFSWEKIAA
jgi:hypothetical protein